MEGVVSVLFSFLFRSISITSAGKVESLESNEEKKKARKPKKPKNNAAKRGTTTTNRNPFWPGARANETMHSNQTGKKTTTTNNPVKLGTTR